jgi:hypothetical protein
MATVDIFTPTGHTRVPVTEPVLVTGTAAAASGVRQVTVAVDGGAPVQATIIPEVLTVVKFTATVPFPGFGSHQIVATAVDYSGAQGSATVTAVLGPPTATPQGSLEITAVNPGPPSSGDWATEIVKQNRSSFSTLASLLSLAVWADVGDQYPVCTREWNQVLAPGEDYDLDSVAFSGWLLQPEISGNDVPFTHPFGFDWECMVALDQAYAGLLAAGNAIPDGADGTQAANDAKTLSIPVPAGGILAVETDGGCIPGAFSSGDTVLIGDRIALLGRWIVDAGHQVKAPGVNSYRAEVHPPLLMAIGGTRLTAADGTVTRIALTSRPYLVKQVYTVDTSKIYDDSAPDDGTLLQHFNNEMNKLTSFPIPESTTIEAHPKIASKPFDGVHIANMRVRPPASTEPAPVQAGPIEVSFQFTCRTGVGVQVVAAEDGVDIMVVLNSAGYVAPPLPPHQDVFFNKDQLAQASDLITFEQVASILTNIDPVSTINAEQALAKGIKSDRYDVPGVNALDRSHMVPFVDISQIPAGQGIVVDDSQPYPVFGWLEIRQARLTIAPPVHFND